jgi:uncharacterized protein YndB with AHSA1/START domain
MNAETIADGEVGKTEDGHDLITFERRIPHPIDAVWAALTEPGQLLKWWGRAEVELEAGGAFTLRWLNEGDDGEGSVLEARIAELEAPRVLDLAGTWAAERADGERFDQSATRLRFELEPDGGATVLRFANTLDFGEERFRTMVPAGWHFHLDALATSLDGGSTDLVNVGGAWNPIHAAYEERERSAA